MTTWQMHDSCAQQGVIHTKQTMKGFRSWRVKVGTGYSSESNTTYFARRKDARNYACMILERHPNAEVQIEPLEPLFKDYQKLAVVGSDEHRQARIGGYGKMPNYGE